MQEEKRHKVIIYSEITDNKRGGRKISSEKLRIFIETYGVNFIDSHGNSIHHLMNYMIKEHIDIIFEYDFNPIYLSSITKRHHLMRIDDQYVRSTYILKRFLDTKYASLFLTSKVVRYGDQFTEMYYIDYLRSRREWKHTNELLMIMENFEKKYYTLFDLLFRLNKNIKLRVY